MQVDETPAQQSSDPSLESTGAVQATSGAASKSGAAQESDMAVNQAPTTGTGQLTLSLLVNHNKDGGAPSDMQQLLSSLPVLLKKEAQDDPTSSTSAPQSLTAVAREMTEGGGHEGQTTSITNVSCSGLLCLIDNGSAEGPPPPAQRELEDNAIITSKTT